eukprot:TRINITY_DN5709_c0_g2_i1.p1 TRINITY_DN5709_c0_g2~~TRINITY_DN5709_c0_g2_i1.p1  ORF type:complete len:585 (+),score=110.23 TRINITY_DN5709_c0_g2_i1:105-1859(+)
MDEQRCGAQAGLMAAHEEAASESGTAPEEFFMGGSSDEEEIGPEELSRRRLTRGALAVLGLLGAVAGLALVLPGVEELGVASSSLHRLTELVMRPSHGMMLTKRVRVKTSDGSPAPPAPPASPTTGIKGDVMLGMAGPGDFQLPAVNLQPPVAGGCADTSPLCSQWAQQTPGGCTGMSQTNFAQCRKTCGLCEKPAVWQAVRGYVADAEGGDAGMTVTNDVGACEAQCEGNPGCKSFTYCLDGKCYFKTQVLTGHEASHENKWCSSHFKSNEYLPVDSSLLSPSAAQEFTFYMYRAQAGPEFYAPGNVNTGTIGGVLWYLHNEVIGTCHGHGFLSKGYLGDRKFKVDRIRRLKVTVKAPTPLLATGLNFGVLQSFDSGETTGPHRATKDVGPGTGFASTPEWDQYGYHVGCGKIGEWPHQDWKSGLDYPNAVWYSLPGPCPQMEYEGETDQCKVAFPGGLCTKATGQGNCTFSYEEAGFIMIDHLVGIEPKWKSREEFCTQCKTEGGPTWKGGCGLDFWGTTVYDQAGNQQRVNLALNEFHTKYPNLPKEFEMQPPACDFDKTKYGFPEDWEVWEQEGFLPRTE